jgi:hypothetical protein
MDFVLNGVSHSLHADDVRSALRATRPEDVREHWVEVDGVRWPPKQAFALVAGVDRAEFTSHNALRQLQRLGFATSAWSGDGRARLVDAAVRQAPGGPAGVPSPTSTCDVVLIGCSGSKAATARPASELFTGATFVKGRDRARRLGVPWYVLSAKYGVLSPDEVIAPYDVYLGDQSTTYRTAWGAWVVAQLSRLHDLTGSVVEVHAGKTYCDPLVQPLVATGAALRQPLAGLRQGERLSWYGRPSADEHIETEWSSPAADVPDVSALLDHRSAVSPESFLASGRREANEPGLYSWWVDAAGAEALSSGLGHEVRPGLIYAGRAGGTRPNGVVSTNTLWGRIGTMHLGGNRSFSTFRLTLTAALAHSGTSVDDERALTEWMRQHLRVAVLPLPSEHVVPAEDRLLELADPPLNLRDVPPTSLRRTLSALRSALS